MVSGGKETTMPVEPHPGMPPAVLAVLATLIFRVTTRDPTTGAAEGVFVDANGNEHFLIVTSGGVDGTWALASPLPAGFGPVLVYTTTATILQEGTATDDGSVCYQGNTYRIASHFNGSHWTAHAVVA